MPRKVVFVHRVTCDYSESFLRKVRDKLNELNIEFQVVSGQPWKNEALIDVVSKLSFARSCINKKVIGPVFWSQGILSEIKSADLVIMEQLNSALHNYLIIFLSRSRRFHVSHKYQFRTAYYGHGLNLNSRSATLRNWWKKKMSLRVDWWFAYTELTKKIIQTDRYNNITVMNNTVDTTSLVKERERYSDNDLIQLNKEVFGTNDHKSTAVFCGRLVELKWIPFLLQSLEKIKESLPEFRMIIIGSGPYSKQVEQFCKEREWCKFVGSKTGPDKVKYLLLADIWLNPGGVGLAIVDAFTVGLPLVTTNNNIHGPEIAYLEDGKNGIVTRPFVNDFACSVTKLFQNLSLLNSLKKESYESSKKYSIDNMVDNFVDGVLKCLNIQKK